MEFLNGSGVPMITPFKEDGEVDFEAVADVFGHQYVSPSEAIN